jgi:hypothetical protein
MMVLLDELHQPRLPEFLAVAFMASVIPSVLDEEQVPLVVVPRFRS